MHKMTLLTYESAKEYRRAALGFEKDGFEYLSVGTDFEEASLELSQNRKTYTDLTSCFAWSSANEFSQIALENIFNCSGNNALFISKAKWSNFALETFPHYFIECRPLCPKDDIAGSKVGMKRKPLYLYKCRAEYDALVSRSEREEAFHFASFSWMRDNVPDLIGLLSNSENEVMIDLTAFAAFDSSGLMLAFESLCYSVPGNLFYIVNEKAADKLFEVFPSVFDSIKDVTGLYEDLVFEEFETKRGTANAICSFEKNELALFSAAFDKRLTGHSKFKAELSKRLEWFRIANSLGDQHILSLFLFGETGVGKTEVARLLNDLLAEGSRLAKINFESYSSQDSLNSLIGSPAGYIGCEGGELNDKLSKAQARILLCDEFEKTSRDVQNFFLELLEDGFYTDRMGHEHDLDGYIIVFTSNIKSEEELNEKIPPELRARIDLMCEFVKPSISEKAEHVQKFAENKAESYRQKLGLSEALDISDINFSLKELEYLSLREINKAIVAQIANRAASVLEKRC